MCFSPEASFAGGVIITIIGVATVTKIHKSSQLVFASIPLFLGYSYVFVVRGNGYLLLNF